jgi:U3 small nucleolar RNA-associated protein 10
MQVINEIEESAITSFLELVVRLNEVTFKPLFIRLYDWAVIDLSEGASESPAYDTWTALMYSC